MLKQIFEDVPGLWEIPGTVKAAGFTLPCRAVIFETSPGHLWMWSPVRMDAETIEAVKALGSVDVLVSPSLMHHLFMGAAQEAFPDAVVWAPRRLKKKRPDLRIDEELREDAFEDLGIKAFAVKGAPILDEWLFYHEPTKTGLVCDIVFNLGTEMDLFSAFVTTLTGTRGRLALSRLVKFAVKDRAAASVAVKAFLEMPFENFVMAHGHPFQGADARPKVKDVLKYCTSGL